MKFIINVKLETEQFDGTTLTLEMSNIEGDPKNTDKLIIKVIEAVEDLKNMIVTE